MIVAYLFLEHCQLSFFFSQEEDLFLLTFMDFFTHVRAWGNVTWKEGTILLYVAFPRSNSSLLTKNGFNCVYSEN